MNQNEFKRWQLKEGLTLYNARTQLLSTTDVLAHIIRDRDIAVFILDVIDFDDLRNITIPEITNILERKKSHHFRDENINLIAEQIVSAIELGRRVSIKSINDQAALGNPIVAREYFRNKFTDILNYEELIVAFLNGGLKVIKWEVAFKGSIRASVISSREILTRALKYGAESIIIAHNHPGGSLEPTEEDRITTKSIKNGCQYLDIRFIDHLIVTDDGCYSIADEERIQ